MAKGLGSVDHINVCWLTLASLFRLQPPLRNTGNNKRTRAALEVGGWARASAPPRSAALRGVGASCLPQVDQVQSIMASFEELFFESDEFNRLRFSAIPT